MAEDQRVEALEWQVKHLRRRVRELEEWQDTVTSALWKRVLWWLQGYRWSRVGRWYGKTEDLM